MNTAIWLTLALLVFPITVMGQVTSHPATRPATRPLVKPPATLVDPAATPQARALMKRLVNNYGKSTLIGVYDEPDAAYIEKTIGRPPDVMGGDLMDFSPSRLPYGADPGDLVERYIAHAKAGRIITLSWHWNAPSDLVDGTYVDRKGKKVDAPWYRGFYTDATHFDVEKALANPESEDYKLLLRDIDAIAVQLNKFQKAGVPVLWRPLHEAEGKWFWWSAKGPKPYIKLWRLMFDRLTKHDGLHNLIWVYTGDLASYPGDAYADVIGVDYYEGDGRGPLPDVWNAMQARFNGKKLLALSEFGGVPDLPAMRAAGLHWSYYASWTGKHGPRPVPPDELRRRLK